MQDLTIQVALVGSAIWAFFLLLDIAVHILGAVIRRNKRRNLRALELDRIAGRKFGE